MDGFTGLVGGGAYSSDFGICFDVDTNPGKMAFSAWSTLRSIQKTEQFQPKRNNDLHE